MNYLLTVFAAEYDLKFGGRTLKSAGETAIMSDSTTMIEESSDQNTKQESEDTVVETLGGSHVSGSSSGSSISSMTMQTKSLGL